MRCNRLRLTVGMMVIPSVMGVARLLDVPGNIARRVPSAQRIEGLGHSFQSIAINGPSPQARCRRAPTCPLI